VETLMVPEYVGHPSIDKMKGKNRTFKHSLLSCELDGILSGYVSMKDVLMGMNT
jgi:hypothetical protein